MEQFGLAGIGARLAIRAAIDSYCRGVDRRDGALIKSAFHADAIDDHGPFVGNAHEFADWIVDRLSSMPVFGQHHVTNCLIVIDSETEARAESYYLAYHPRRDEESGRVVLLQNGGRYLDLFEKRDGEWRIAKRKVTVDWSRAELPGEQWDGQGNFPPPGEIGNDASDWLFGPGGSSPTP